VEGEGRRAPLAPDRIDMLEPGDVLVVDVGGNIEAGGIIGDNLAYYIWKKTGAGFVIDGAIRTSKALPPSTWLGTSEERRRRRSATSW